MNKDLQDRILGTTRGTRLGAILRNAMDRNEPGQLPQFVGKASITSDGFLMCDFIDCDGNGHHGAFVGSWRDFNDNIKGLARHLDLKPSELRELVELANSCIGKDWRSQHKTMGASG